MKFCVNCGKQLEDKAAVCPGCAAIQPEMPEQAQPSYQPFQQGPQQPQEPEPKQQTEQSCQNQPASQESQPDQQPQQPYFQQYPQPNGAEKQPNFQQNGNQFYWQGPQNSGAQNYGPYLQGYPGYVRKPNATGYLIWSIILIFFCQPIGIVATIFAGLAMSSNSNYEEAVRNIKVSRILCIIGTCLAAVLILVYIGIFTASFFVSRG